MLSACRQDYQSDPRMLVNIEKFERTYHKEECIRWYTKETIVYKLINAALRTEDIEQLYIFRYYITNLSRQLTQEAMHRPDTVAALYEIEYDLEEHNDSVIFADVSRSSEFLQEGEYLFDPGSLFQIKDIRKEEKDGNKQYIIRVRATSEGQKVASSYIDQIRTEMKYESPRIMVGILLKRIGKYDKSLAYFQQLLENPGEEKMADIHNRIGTALRLQHKYDSALTHCNIAYNLTSKSDSPERAYLAFIRHDQGQVYFKQRKRPLALEYYQEAVDIITEKMDAPNPYIADCYASFERLYASRYDFQKAMEYQRKALRVREAYLPPWHVFHAFSYFDIAQILSSQKEYKKALEYHLKALELRQNYLLPYHLNTALSLHFVGQMYHKLQDLEKARDYYWKALKMKRECLPDSRPYITPSILQDIARTYEWRSQEALDYRLEAYEIQQSAEPVDHPSLARLLNDIGFTYKLMGNLQDSLKFYQQVLKIREEKLCEKTLSLSSSFNNLAYLYEAIKDMKSAFIYHHKALKIYEYSYPDDHWHCEMSRRSIQRVTR